MSRETHRTGRCRGPALGTFDRAIGSAWRLRLTGDAAPTALARLVVELPDKYPGQTLVFPAKIGTATGQAALSGRLGRWSLDLSADIGRTWSYSADAQLTRDLLGVRLAFGRVW